MTEEEAIFDPSLPKKKSEKKKPFDFDAEKEDASKDTGNDFDENLVSESVVKKNKKKKRPFNLEELEANLPAESDEKKDEVVAEGIGEEGGNVEDDYDLDVDFSKTKKKKKKKKELDELVAEKVDDGDEAQKENVEDSSTTWSGSDRDYTYDELLSRVFEIILDKNPDMAAGRKPKFVMRPPQVLRVGTKKTSFANFTDICRTLHRQPKHLLDFLLAELGTSGSMDGNQQLIIKGRFQPKQIENVLRRYIKEYVTCHTCRSPETILQKDTRLFFLQCESCGSRCSVASIKSGFQAVTSKRAAIRAKNA